MTKYSRPKQRAAHMHPYQRDKPTACRGNSGRDSSTQEQAGNTRNNAPQADPPQASASVNDENDKGGDDDLEKPVRPQPHSFGQLRILPSAALSLAPNFVVSNPRKTGPQTDICARVPGRLNTWVARISCQDTMSDFKDLMLSNSGLKSTAIDGVCERAETTYTIRRYEPEVVQVIDHVDRNLICWTDAPDTDTVGHEIQSRDLETSDIPGILGEEGMKMVDPRWQETAARVEEQRKELQKNEMRGGTLTLVLK
ncbi:Ff.00g061740.m01.CDS01 [Fusarium sp. VM40]|nr:Ff.00g061740.m01.CDS01 [Fusarium sp. VM40]